MKSINYKVQKKKNLNKVNTIKNNRSLCQKLYHLVKIKVQFKIIKVQ